MTSVLMREDTDKRRHSEDTETKGRGHVKMKVAIGMIHLKAKEWQALLAATRRQERGTARFFLGASEGNNLTDVLTLGMWPPEL